MPPHEQEVEDQDGEAEGIVVAVRRDAQRAAQQLGRHEAWVPTRQGTPAVAHLETVAIDRCDRGIRETRTLE